MIPHPVDTDPPPEGKRVLVYVPRSKLGRWIFAKFWPAVDRRYDYWESEEDSIGRIKPTHWLPEPEPPIYERDRRRFINELYRHPDSQRPAGR